MFSEYTAQKKNEYPLRLTTKVNNPQTSEKTYWFILKTLANVRKIPVIPHLPINNKLVSDFKVRKKKLRCSMNSFAFSVYQLATKVTDPPSPLLSLMRGLSRLFLIIRTY